MAVILVNSRAYQTKQYRSNKEAPIGVRHCGDRLEENGHGHLEDSGNSVSDKSWLIYKGEKVIKIISDEQFQNGDIGIL